MMMFLLLCFCVWPTDAKNKFHYGDPSSGCQSGEVADSIQNFPSLDACFPKCLEYNNCPKDVGPEGTTAYGMCLLSGPKPELDKHCFLTCVGVFGKGVCPPGSQCTDTGDEFSVCLWPKKETDFDSYLTAFNKSYPVAQMPLRRTLYERRAHQWSELRMQHPHARFGPTKFADWTDKELARLRPAVLPTQTNATMHPRPTLQLTSEDIAAAPESLDWRMHGAVTPIKDQKQCGGCWAFSTIGNIEGAAVVQKSKALVSLSEQQLLDCSSYCGSYRGYFGCNTGCGGGLQGAALDDLTTGSLKEQLVDSEVGYPFVGKTDKKCTMKGKDGILAVPKWEWVDTDEDKIKAAVAKYGPLAVSVNDGGKGGSWMSYKGGVLSGGRCKGDLNHGVTLIGYGTDKASGKPYWLVKNSWGEGWGDKGYIMLERGTCECGICKSACTALF